MTTDEAAFLRAIAESPSDDAPRLVFADWLADRDDPRAAWVRDADIWEWMRPDARDPLPALVATLGDRTDWPRMWRARAVLQKLGTVGIRAVWAWLREFPEEWPEVRDLRPLPPANLRPLAELVARLHADTWQEAAEATHDLRFHPPDVVLPVLARVLDEGMRDDLIGGENDPFGEAIMDTASTFGPAADLMVPTIASKVWWMNHAETALRRIRPDPEVVYQHISCSEHEFARYGLFAVTSLAPDPTAMLVRIVRTNDERGSAAAVEIIGERVVDGEIDPADALPLFLEVLQSETRYDEFMRGLAVRGITQCGDPSVLPALFAALDECLSSESSGRWLHDELTDAIRTLHPDS